MSYLGTEICLVLRSRFRNNGECVRGFCGELKSWKVIGSYANRFLMHVISRNSRLMSNAICLDEEVNWKWKESTEEWIGILRRLWRLLGPDICEFELR